MRYYSDFQSDQQPFEPLIGTDTEDFVLGEIVTLSAGAATKAGVDSTGEQKYICMNAVTGDGATRNLVGMRLRKDAQFKTVNPGSIVEGNKYTLNAAATEITTTTTNGVFEVDKILNDDFAIGHFASVDAI